MLQTKVLYVGTTFIKPKGDSLMEVQEAHCLLLSNLRSLFKVFASFFSDIIVIFEKPFRWGDNCIINLVSFGATIV